ncbi:hypothetical protein O181_027511 [Austropuccinia psidii MF-1]|uniref:type II protein arginine methyltransferase n=1 Tax=Austropuccinia psidii MF-1 TaxID=1389203 RepID=A0A9Q3H1I3_9BASI|nr:hypothetical protein [Austropuccinia psidii MF-1]
MTFLHAELNPEGFFQIISTKKGLRRAGPERRRICSLRHYHQAHLAGECFCLELPTRLASLSSLLPILANHSASSFKKSFSCSPCHLLPSHPAILCRLGSLQDRHTRINLRLYSTKQSYRYNYNPDPFSQDESDAVKQVIDQFAIVNHQGHPSQKLKLLNPNQLAKFHHHPIPSISLTRDFLFDCLYNPNYGYFFNQVEILDRSNLRSNNSNLFQSKDQNYLNKPTSLLEFERDLSNDYSNQLVFKPINQSIQPQTSPSPNSTQIENRQIWHTPTELFKPWYARSIARFIISSHLQVPPSSSRESPDRLTTQSNHSNHHPLKPLKIVEIGAGNGTLCQGILDYIHEYSKELYERTSYQIIELSTRLINRQREKLKQAGHLDRVQIINQSILFDLDELETLPSDRIKSQMTLKPDSDPCWVIGLEVLDNLPRDVIRRDRITQEPLQSIVITDRYGDFHERFIPITNSTNPKLVKFLSILQQLKPISKKSASLEVMKTKFEKFKASFIPFYPNLAQQEFIPTNYFIFIQNLFYLFPNHRLIISDFDRLTNCLKGKGGPVIQTRYNGMTIPVTTFLVKPGLFDIFFPTDFKQFIELYKFLKPTLTDSNNSSFNHQNDPASSGLKLYDHSEFFKIWIEKSSSNPNLNNVNHLVKFKDGSNILLDYYQNVKVLVSQQ